MDRNDPQITPMTREYAALIARWKYAGDYAFYDHSDEHIDEFLDGNHYVSTSADGGLIGYYCFGSAARIPTVEEDAYTGDYLDIGLGMRPDLCGRGMGRRFMESGLSYAAQLRSPAAFRLSVAAFNGRAIRLYANIGFRVQREVTNSYFHNRFYIMTRGSIAEGGCPSQYKGAIHP